MKLKEIEKTNSNSSKTTIGTIETTPNDGFVSEKDIRPYKYRNEGKYHKGYSKTYTYTTNNPTITRIFVIVLTVALLIFGYFFAKILPIFGYLFMVVVLLMFVKSMFEINKISKQLKKNQEDSNLSEK